MEAGPPEMVAHTHRLPPVVRAAIVGMVAASLLEVAAIVLLAVDNFHIRQYMEGRGELRDREQVALEQRIDERARRAVCDVLDQLPEGGLLDRPRGKYECGPGIPIDQLSPDERAEIANRLPPEPPTNLLPEVVPPRTVLGGPTG